MFSRFGRAWAMTAKGANFLPTDTRCSARAMPVQKEIACCLGAVCVADHDCDMMREAVVEACRAERVPCDGCHVGGGANRSITDPNRVLSEDRRAKCSVYGDGARVADYFDITPLAPH